MSAVAGAMLSKKVKVYGMMKLIEHRFANII